MNLQFRIMAKSRRNSYLVDRMIGLLYMSCYIFLPYTLVQAYASEMYMVGTMTAYGQPLHEAFI